MDHVQDRHDFADPAAHDRQRGAYGGVGAAPFELEKRERDGGQHDMMGPAAIAPAFKMIEAEFIFEFPTAVRSASAPGPGRPGP